MLRETKSRNTVTLVPTLLNLAPSTQLGLGLFMINCPIHNPAVHHDQKGWRPRRYDNEPLVRATRNISAIEDEIIKKNMPISREVLNNDPNVLKTPRHHKPKVPKPGDCSNKKAETELFRPLWRHMRNNHPHWSGKVNTINHYQKGRKHANATMSLLF